jgi:hypothetical protein
MTHKHPTGAERRRHPRVPKRLLLKFRGVKGVVPPEIDDKVGSMMEVSRGGMTLKAKKVYGPGCVLRLFLPESELGPARTLHGRVSWSRPSPAHDGFLMGLQFVRFDAADESAPAMPSKVVTTRRYVTSDLGAAAERHTKRFTPRAAQPSGAERRRHPRWEQRILVKYKCVTKGMFHELEDRVGMLLDFSRSGLVLTCLKEYPTGHVIEVKFPETPLGPARTVFARIVWTRAHDKPGQFRVGGEFVEPEKQK